MANKNWNCVLVTGGTGDVGGAYTQVLLENGYKIHAPVRKFSKMLTLFNSSKIISEEIDFEDSEKVGDYLRRCSEQEIFFDGIVLATGDFKRDDEFSYIDEDLREREARRILMNSCYDTKKTFIDGLKENYGPSVLKKMTIIIVASHAALYHRDEPRISSEKAHIYTSQMVAQLGSDLKEEDVFENVFIEYPNLLKPSRIARQYFPDLHTEESPLTFARKSLHYAELI